MISKKLLTGALLSSTLFLQGCMTMGVAKNSEFSCAGGYQEEGVSCLSASEIYKATNNTETINGKDFQKKKEQVKVQKIIQSTSISNLIDTSKASIPLMTQEGMLRVWIAPWIDKNDQLHSGEFIFKKVKEAEWVMGVKANTQEAVEKRTLFSLQGVKESEKPINNKGSLKRYADEGKRAALDFLGKKN